MAERWMVEIETDMDLDEILEVLADGIERGKLSDYYLFAKVG